MVLTNKQQIFLDYMTEHPGATTLAVGIALSGVIAPDFESTNSKLRDIRYHRAYIILDVLEKQGLLYKEKNGEEPMQWFPKNEPQQQDLPPLTAKQTVVLTLVSGRKVVTSQDVGMLYYQFRGTPAHKDTPTKWGYRMLQRLAVMGLVHRFGLKNSWFGWSWSTTPEGEAYCPAGDDVGPCQEPDELEGFVDVGGEDETTNTPAQEAETETVPLQQYRIHLPALTGLAFHLLCEKQNRDPSTVAEELVYRHLVSSPECGMTQGR